MNFILCLFIVTHFCLLEVKCRSVQLNHDVHSVLEDGDDIDVNHNPESSGIFSWKKLKPILRREVQRIGIVEDQARKIDGESPETKMSLLAKEDGENILEVLKEEKSPEVESQGTNTSSTKSELNTNTQNEERFSESNTPEEFPTNMTHLEMFKMDHSSISDDLPGNIIYDILNRSSDSILLQVLNDNSSDIGSLEFDETALLSEGGHVATLQEVSTAGFELLIDSETKQNTILAQLLTSQSNLIDDDFDNSTDEEDISFHTMELFNHRNGSELQKITMNEQSTGNLNSEFDESGTEHAEIHTDDESGTENLEIHTYDVAGTVNSEIRADEAGTENTEFYTDDEARNENLEIHTDNEERTENLKIHTDDESGTENSEIHTNDVAGSVNSEIRVDEAVIKNTEFYTDEARAENTEIHIDDETETGDIEFNIDDQVKAEINEFSTDSIEITEISSSVMMKNTTINETELSGLVQDDSVTENRSTEIEGPKCPDPGWCIFWFLALDTCAKDSHCHGSLLCCMIGCSKTCIDPDTEF